MTRWGFVGRGFAAILLTGLVSPAIFAVGFAVFGLAQSAGRTFSGIDEFISAVWFFGTLVALPCAALLGVCVEWPKSRWLLRHRSARWWPSLLISLFAAEVLLLSLPLIEMATRGASPLVDPAGNLFFFIFAAAIGGGCSAAFWWWLVVRPGRNFTLRQIL